MTMYDIIRRDCEIIAEVELESGAIVIWYRDTDGTGCVIAPDADFFCESEEEFKDILDFLA